MKHSFINNWYNWSVFLAGASALVALFLVDDLTAKLLWMSVSVLFLHFFEEFGFPGGFPLLGMKVLMNSNETDSTKWDCNNLSSMFAWWEYVVAIVWFIFVFWFCFRSPTYWSLGRKPGYELTEQTAFGWMKK